MEFNNPTVMNQYPKCYYLECSRVMPNVYFLKNSAADGWFTFPASCRCHRAGADSMLTASLRQHFCVITHILL